MAWCTAAVLTSALVSVVALESTMEPTEWWHTAVIYQVYVRSFMDSNADGVGDINGIIQKLPYFHMLGVQAICLSPIFHSPMVDQGYDISDFRTVDPLYGDNAAFYILIREAKEHNLKVLLDFVPNHSSDQHDWFLHSVKRTDPYSDYYVWRDGKPNPKNSSQPDPPNNWLSRYGGSAWEWNHERNQFYLHTYLAEQPDLNFRYAPVVEEIKDVIEFWLQKGVDGFRMVGVVNLYENESFLDEPLVPVHEYNESNYDCLVHQFTTNLNETLDMVRQWRQVLDEYKEQTNSSTRLLIVDADTDVNHVLLYYGNSTHPGALPLNPLFLRSFTKWSTSKDFAFGVQKWYDLMHEGRWANWVLGTPDVSRAASRYGEEKVDALHMLSLLLPGTAFTYYGEELGMKDIALQWHEIKHFWGGNNKTRDLARTPFQWDSSTYAGFSASSSTWLPVNYNSAFENLYNQQRDKRSHYSVYWRLVAARQETSIAKGTLYIQALESDVVSFSRAYKNHDTFLVVINFGNSRQEVKLEGYNLSESDPLLVHTATKDFELKQGEIVSPTKIELPPYSAVVLTTGQVNDYKMSRSGSSVQPSSAVLRTLGVTLLVLYSICN